jgi:hypothetical protein
MKTSNIKRKVAVTQQLKDEESGVFASFTENAYHVVGTAFNSDHLAVFEGMGLRVTDIRLTLNGKVNLILKEVKA